MTIKREISMRAADAPVNLFVLSKDKFEDLVLRYPVLGRRIVQQLKEELLDRVGPAGEALLYSCLANPLFASPVLLEEDPLTPASPEENAAMPIDEEMVTPVPLAESPKATPSSTPRALSPATSPKSNPDSKDARVLVREQEEEIRSLKLELATLQRKFEAATDASENRCKLSYFKLLFRDLMQPHR
jgi:hypothetical protein